MSACGTDHVWTLFCAGFWEGPRKPPYWRVDICVKCYAKRQVLPAVIEGRG